MFLHSRNFRKVEEITENFESIISPIDQFDAQDFNINECGFIRNDISKLARAASQSEYDALMRKIGMVDANYNIKDGMTIQQAMDMVKPRYAQSACEIANYAEYISKMSDMNKSYDDVHVPDAKDVPESSGDSDGSKSE